MNSVFLTFPYIVDLGPDEKGNTLEAALAWEALLFSLPEAPKSPSDDEFHGDSSTSSCPNCSRDAWRQDCERDEEVCNECGYSQKSTTERTESGTVGHVPSDASNAVEKQVEEARKHVLCFQNMLGLEGKVVEDALRLFEQHRKTGQYLSQLKYWMTACVYLALRQQHNPQPLYYLCQVLEIDRRYVDEKVRTLESENPTLRSDGRVLIHNAFDTYEEAARAKEEELRLDGVRASALDLFDEVSRSPHRGSLSTESLGLAAVYVVWRHLSIRTCPSQKELCVLVGSNSINKGALDFCKQHYDFPKQDKKRDRNVVVVKTGDGAARKMAKRLDPGEEQEGASQTAAQWKGVRYRVCYDQCRPEDGEVVALLLAGEQGRLFVNATLVEGTTFICWAVVASGRGKGHVGEMRTAAERENDAPCVYIAYADVVQMRVDTVIHAGEIVKHKESMLGLALESSDENHFVKCFVWMSEDGQGSMLSFRRLREQMASADRN